MSVHLQREIERLKRSVLSLCAVVENQVYGAVRALLDRDEEAARKIEMADLQVDQQEVEVEEECLKVLALHQPVAVDLRFIIAALKINGDLERIGDLAANIARKAMTFSRQPPMEIPFDLYGMWEKTQGMLRDALNSLVNLDAHLAAEVCGRDDQVDDMKREIRKEVEVMIRKDPEAVTSLMTLAAVARNLERVADHATNIAEDVVYMVEGKIARHGEIDVA